jgi:hypothetical protein
MNSVKVTLITAATLVLTCSASRAQVSSVITNCGNDSQLQAAVQKGGTITFSCSGTPNGSGQFVIPLSSGISVNNNTVIDGTGQQIVLSATFDRTIYLGAGGNLVVNNLTIALANITTNYGDGVITNNGGGNLVVENTLITGSPAYAISADNRTKNSIANSTFTGAKGVRTLGGNLSITNGTLITTSVAIENDSGQISVANTIISGSASCSGSVTDGGYNLANDSSCNFNTASSSKVGKGNLGPLQFNGGYTQSYAPLDNSLSIIPPGVNGCAAGLTSDQIGQTRPGNTSAQFQCSIGAVEYQDPAAAIIKDCADDSQLQSSAANGGRIVFACSGTINMSSVIFPNSRLILDGTGQSVTLNGNGRQVFSCNDCAFNHLNFTGGGGNGGAGGAIYIRGTLIVENSTFYGNNVNSSGSKGGAIATLSPDQGSIYLVNDTFANNEAATGGAVYSDNGQISAVSSSFLNNTGNGGATYSGNQQLAVASSVFQGNTSNSQATCAGNLAADGGYNFADDSSCGFTQTTSVQSVNPGLTALGNYGGSVESVPLSINGVATAAIPFSVNGCGTYVVNDDLGTIRPQFSPKGLACDAGAFQNPSYPAVTAAPTNNSQFGNESVGTKSAPQNINFNINFPVTISKATVVTQGVSGLDFQLSGNTCTGAMGGACSVSVTFTPQVPGLREGAIILYDQNNDVLSTQYISGIGQGPAVAFNSVPQTTLTLPGLSSPAGLATDAAGNLYVNSTANQNVYKYANGQLSTFGQTANLAIAIDGAGKLQTGVAGIAVTAAGTVVTNASAQIALDSNGNQYVAVTGAGVNVYAAGQTSNPQAFGFGTTGCCQTLAVDAAGDIYAGGSSGVFELPVGQTTPIQLSATAAKYMTLDGLGNLYFTDGTNVYELPRATLPSLNFSTPVPVYSSAVLNITVQNIGNASNPTLTLNTNGDQNFDFEAGANGANCPAGGLVPGASCTLTLTFQPAVSGSISENDLFLTTDVPGRQRLPLLASGFGQPLQPATGYTTSLAGSNSSLSAAYGTSFTVTFSSTSGAVANITNSGNCTVNVTNGSSGAQVVMSSGVGSCTLNASWPATQVYAAAGPLSVSIQAQKAPLTVSAPAKVSLPFGSALPVLPLTYAGFVNGDNGGNSSLTVPNGTLPSVVSGSAYVSTGGANSSSLPGMYTLTPVVSGLSSNDYSFTAVNGTLTVTSEGALANGNACNGAYTSNFTGNITVAANQFCVLDGAGVQGGLTVKGNIVSSGGILVLNAVTVTGNVQISGSFTGSAVSPTHAICGSNIQGNVLVQNNTSPISVGGQYDGSGCAGNAITGNLQVQNNTGTATVTESYNTVQGNIQVQNNAGSVSVTHEATKANLQVTNNTGTVIANNNTVTGTMQVQNNGSTNQVNNNNVSGNLQCSGDSQINASGNTAKSIQGQCVVSTGH